MGLGLGLGSGVGLGGGLGFGFGFGLELGLELGLGLGLGLPGGAQRRLLARDREGRVVGGGEQPAAPRAGRWCRQRGAWTGLGIRLGLGLRWGSGSEVGPRCG